MISILHIASLIEPIGALTLGGAERFLAHLAAYQAKTQRWNVFCHAVTGSQFENSVKFIDLQIPQGAIRSIDICRDYRHLPSSESETFERQQREKQTFAPIRAWLEENPAGIDLIHNHAYDEVPLFELNALRIPIIHTLHLPPILPWINQRFQTKQADWDLPWVRHVTVSDTSQEAYRTQTSMKPLVIPCGENLQETPYSETPGEHFLWVGRISPEKGLDLALDLIVEKMGKPLRVLGGVYDVPYFDSLSNRLNHPLVDYRGRVSHDEVQREMSRARALVFTPCWEEPFGLVIIESLAAGTPVVSLKRGAAPTILKHGETGFLASSPEEMCVYLEQVGKISRKHCRDYALAHFSLSSVENRYQELYRELLRVRF